MNSNKNTARIAGLLYLLNIITGIFALMYVPSKLIIWDNASATFENIVAHESLFRLGILSGLICFTSFIFLPLVLYELLKPVNKRCSIIMVILALISVPLYFTNVSNKFDVLTLVSNADYLKVFDLKKIQAQVLFYLRSYDNGNQIGSIFWGLWLLPFGYLIFKSKFLPKIFGILLIIGCFGYLIDFIGYFLFPDYEKTIIPGLIGLPAGVGEIGICLWLLIVGIRTDNQNIQKV